MWNIENWSRQVLAGIRLSPSKCSVFVSQLQCAVSRPVIDWSGRLVNGKAGDAWSQAKAGVMLEERPGSDYLADHHGLRAAGCEIHDGKSMTAGTTVFLIPYFPLGKSKRT